MKRILIVLAVSLGFIVSALPSAWGGYLDVCPSGCVYSKIQDAINASLSGDTIRVAQGIYYENISITTSKDFTLEGGWNSAFTARSSDASLTVINGNASGSVFSVIGGINVTSTIDCFTITNGMASSGGGISVSADNNVVNLTIQNSIITKNKTPYNGGWGGGGIYTSVGQSGALTLTLNNNIISENTSAGGGGVYVVVSNPSQTMLSFTNNTFDGNIGQGGGGGILIIGGSTTGSIVIEGNTIVNNKVGLPPYDCSYNTFTFGGSGGGIYLGGLNASASLNISNNLIKGNYGGYGGGIYVEGGGGGSQIIQNKIIENVGCGGGGGIGINGAYNIINKNGNVTNNIISKNRAGAGIGTYSGYGGGIGVFNVIPGTLHIDTNLIEGNSAYFGGGIYFHSAAGEGARIITVSKNSVLKNSAYYQGSGIYIGEFSLGDYTFTQNIITRNIVQSVYGGAFYHYPYGNDIPIKVTNNTIVCNDGGGFFDESSSPQPSIINTILWNNSWYGGYQNLRFVNPSSITYSDIGPPDYDNYKNKGYHNLSVDPLFVDPENGDFRLQKRSRLIDRGDIVILDPDGSRSDIGAIPYGLIDSDGDGILDINDNCPAIFNPDQEDSNNNGIGDVCEALGCK